MKTKPKIATTVVGEEPDFRIRLIVGCDVFHSRGYTLKRTAENAEKRILDKLLDDTEG